MPLLQALAPASRSRDEKGAVNRHVSFEDQAQLCQLLELRFEFHGARAPHDTDFDSDACSRIDRN